MSASLRRRLANPRAPHFAGALFLALACLFTACKEERTAPDWSESAPSSAEGTPERELTPTLEPRAAPVVDPPPAPTREPDPEPDALRFLSYNLKNYLHMSRYVDGRRDPEAFKPGKEIGALVKIIVDARPDIVGVCEVGSPDTLEDLQGRLREAGLDLPHARHAGGNDATRFLGLLSRHPIQPPGRAPDLRYTLRGTPMVMSRGILDARIAINGHDFHFLGAHLKSKREIPEADQELMRRNEAYLLRKHADTIFDRDPEAIVIVYGDLNDTRRSTAVRSIQGAYDAGTHLEAVHHPDSRAEVWTHYWDYQHVYSRFDYVLVSKALRKAVVHDQCVILDDPLWRDASDHRALLTCFDLGRLPARKASAPAPSPPVTGPEPVAP